MKNDTYSKFHSPLTVKEVTVLFKGRVIFNQCIS